MLSGAYQDVPRVPLPPRMRPCEPWPDCVRSPVPSFPGGPTPGPFPAGPWPSGPPGIGAGAPDWTRLLVLVAGVSLLILGVSALGKGG